ncbi:M1 family metallopeptidase [Flavisolibacter nicotianae]|uniref:M1 family metallopeptidase n=1 Tax=Flavisolibacter nicotianae TaxID=2364882 RepID=UPI000EB0897A|nr:M1 family metallopeptidase [Flavisolibacter nicotianae]
MKQILSFVTVLMVFSASAQSLPKPPEIQKAFTLGTRSEDGRPGKNYWQNRARYTITVTATPPDRTIRGHEDITYINNSPDALKELVLKLFLNIHKQGAPRMGPAGKDYLTNGTIIDSVSVNGKAVAWTNSPNTFTVATLPLPEPLAAHDSLQLSFAWHYEISLQSNREGMIDSTSYYLAYIYPRIAVYDDYNGWDTTPFNDALEFYSDFNDYTLNVQVPKNYLVWATGTLTNAPAVLQPAFLQKFQQSFTTNDVIRVVTPQDLAAKNVTTQNDLNTWQFTSKNIPDVALGLSDHYVWDAGSVVVDKTTGRRATVNAAYNDTASDYHYMVSFGKQSLDFLSNNWPGVPYPYEKTSVFQGVADMEYPMMVNDNSFADTTFAKFVVMHEIAHTYMPFYMGINETQYGFMDEGWATTFEYLFNTDKMGKASASDFYKQFRVQGWLRAIAQGAEQPILTPGTELQGFTLGDNEYGKPSLGYLAAKELLGDALFKKALQEYMARWNGKHPIPWDFFNSINNAAGRNLNWFWNRWFFTNNHIDLAVKQVRTAGGLTTVVVQNNGGMPAPFDVVVTYANGKTASFHQTPAVWQNAEKEATIKVKTTGPVRSVKLEGGIFMDANPKDNEWKK